jgi:staphylococcal nuclease domain-containing protein 1
MSDKSTKDTSKQNNQGAKQNQNTNTNQPKPSKQEQKTSNDNNTPPPKQEQAPQPAAPAPVTNPQAQPSQPQQPKPVVTKEKGRGNVKAVLSGDTIIVVHLEKNQQGPPLEREITISNITAPKLGRRKTQKNEATQDEPFAWQSREFLRQLTIGKQVTYTIEYKAPAGQNNRSKEYGVVYLVGKGSDQETLAKLIVTKGWATVRRPKTDKEPREDVAELIQLEEDAKKSGIGLFDKTLSTEDTIRPTAEINTTEFFEKYRGKPLSGVVEQVITGNNLRLTLLPSFFNTTLYLSGIECPPENEPFSREAKFFSEYYVLNRDVTVILEGVDKYNLFGSVSFQGKNLGEQLLAAGVARYVDWSGAKTAFQEQLRKAEKSAREGKLRVWSLAAPAPAQNNNNKQAATDASKSKLKPGREVVGKVVRVIHGGAIRVKEPSGAEHDVYFSSVKLPRQGNAQQRKNETKDEAIERSLAWEAKEYVRRRLIGQRVRCVIDYVKDLSRENEPSVERAFYSVYLDKNNIAVELVDHGLAASINHTGPSPRSRDYEHILFAERRAKQNEKGIHTPKDRAVVIHINDLTGSKDKDSGAQKGKDTSAVTKAKQFLPFLKRAGKQKAVVEHVASASRLRIYVPKEGCLINFSLSGINVPRYSEESPEEFAEEAYNFIVDKVQQHDVEFEVITQGRTGNFIGNIWVNKENLAALLLAEGLAEINRPSLKDNQNVATEFIIAEDSAKKTKKNLWKNYDPKKEEEERKKRFEEENDRKKPKQELIDIVVTEIVDATRFYIQISQPEAAQALEALMQKLAAPDESPAYKPKVGEIVKAQFTADDVWYRAEVTSIVDGQYEVNYIDYGNSETIPESRIRKLDASLGLNALKRQAYEAQLAFIIPPGIDDEHGGDAADLFRDLVWGKNLVANIERRERLGEKENMKEKLHLMIVDNKDGVLVNGVMLREGLARLEKIVERRAREGEDKVAQSLKMEEDLARSDHLFMWEYGDPGFDDPDEEPRKKK